MNLRWLEPKALAGQEAVYVTGKNVGQMRVKSAGLLGAVGFISLEPNDARARKPVSTPSRRPASAIC